MRNMVSVFVLALLLVTFVAADGEPYVEDGEFVASIVLGEDAPVQDVIFAGEVQSYLQQFADEASTGVTVTEDDVDLSDDEVLILLGTPENNPLVEEVLEAPELIDGPVVATQGSVTVITGEDQDDVQAAVIAFRAGQRSLGDAELDVPEDSGRDDFDDVLDEPLDAAPQDEQILPDEDESGLPPVGSENEVPGSTEPVLTPPIEDCTASTYCAGNSVKRISASCEESVLEFCPNGCEDGACVQTWVDRFVGLLLFWR